MMQRYSPTLFLSAFVFIATAPPAVGQTCPPTGVSLTFDSVSVPSGQCADATSYLAGNGITFTPVTPGAAPVICNAGPDSAAIPVSKPNYFAVNAAPGQGNQPLTYTFNFCTPLSTVSFWRTGIISISTGPSWTGTAYDAQGLAVGAGVGEGLTFGPPPQQFTITGAGADTISSLTIAANNEDFATFTDPPLDNFTLARGNGVDVSGSFCPGSATVWRNMLASGIQFVMAEAWRGLSGGKYPPCPQEQLPAAQAATLTVDGQILTLTTGAYAVINFEEGQPNGDVQIGNAITAICQPALPPCGTLNALKVMAVDVEPLPGEHFGKTGHNVISVADRINSIVAAVGAIQNAGLKPVIYTSRDNWQTITGNCERSSNTSCNSLVAGTPLWDTESREPDGTPACGDQIPGLESFTPFSYGGWQTRSGNQFDLGPEPCNGYPKLFGAGYGMFDLDYFDPALFQ
jgi:hypothetical protein